MPFTSRLAALVFVLLVSLPWRATAEGGAATASTANATATEYQAAISQALAEHELGHYEEARTLFAKAHALSPSARTWRGLGMVEFELRNYPDCIRALEAALSNPTKPLEGAMRSDAEALLARAREFVAQVELDVRPAVATSLLVDGVAASPTDKRALLLGVGEHVLELSAPGYQSEKRRLNVVGGKAEKLLVMLTKTAAADDAPIQRKRPLYKNPWLWAGVGVVALGAGALGLGLSLRKEPRDHTVAGDPEIMGGLVQTLRFGR